MRRGNAFRGAMLLVQRARVDHRLGCVLTAEHHQEVADHDGFAVLVEMGQVPVAQLLQCHYGVAKTMGTMQEIMVVMITVDDTATNKEAISWAGKTVDMSKSLLVAVANKVQDTTSTSIKLTLPK